MMWTGKRFFNATSCGEISRLSKFPSIMRLTPFEINSSAIMERQSKLILPIDRDNSSGMSLELDEEAIASYIASLKSSLQKRGRLKSRAIFQANDVLPVHDGPEMTTRIGESIDPC